MPNTAGSVYRQQAWSKHTPPERTEAAMDRITTSRPGLRSQIWQFARHFLEMCVAMCVGGGILNGLVFVAGPALLGYPDLRQQSPELALLVIAFDFTLPMMLWMRFRGMAWRPILEMSGATIGLALVMIGLDWLDVVQTSTLRGLVFGFCGPACVVMLVVMLFRLELYTGRSGHHLGPVRHTVHAA
jgi:hypothetical protein